jgi:amino acid adenylation domain-containing protein
LTINNSDTFIDGLLNEGQAFVGSSSQQSYAQNICIPRLVEQQAIATPGAQALVDGHVAMSYAQLNQRANQLAAYLRNSGVGANTLVGLCIERSIDMIVGLLGILKAGGAYVPLDPEYPSDRLKFMLDDAQVSLLVTRQHLAERLELVNTNVVCVDSDAAKLAAQSIENLTVEIAPTDLAYVIYTSGSTGLPKGVEITHGNLLNLIFWHQRAFSVTASDRATQVASPAFDAAVWEIWPYLGCGASIYLVNENTRLLAPQLRDWLLDNAITITFLPTPLAERVLREHWPSKSSLRFMLTGGDVLHFYPAPDAPFTLVNNYGPTESTVVATSGNVLPSTSNSELPSIGRAIDNTRIYILDESMQPVSVGEVGEIYIGGKSLAKGYLHRPELTAEKFVTHSFNANENIRLYKTGDIAKYLSDGQIAFLGRADSQVKIRGFRIELGEIEGVLNSYSAIQQAVVIASENASGEKQLVAYLVPATLASEQPLRVAELRAFLQERLPDYMIPAIFVRLESVPLTANGKVDRAALPLPSAENTLVDEASSSATADASIEQQVMEIIASVLGVETVGLDENFFTLGGHSLLGAQVIIQVEAVFGVKMSLRTLFNAPTVRELALEIEKSILAKLETMSEDELHLMLD